MFFWNTDNHIVKLVDSQLIATFASIDASQEAGYQVLKHNIPSIWLETQGEGVKIAVIDTGVQVPDHVDLQGRIKGGKRFTGIHRLSLLEPWINKSEKKLKKGKLDSVGKKKLEEWKAEREELLSSQDDYTDGHSHGSHVSGIIAANNNTIGIVGVAPQADIYALKALNDSGSGAWSEVAAAVDHAIDLGVDIISMSLGGSSGNSKLKKAIKRAYKKNISIVCAAGNSGATEMLGYPAEYKETIAIGAIDKENKRAWFSSTGARLDFMAPGVEIISTVPTNAYGSYSGTSMATPWVAAVIALMLAKHRKLGGKTPVDTVKQIKEHLQKISIPMGSDFETGYGIIDPTKI